MTTLDNDWRVSAAMALSDIIRDHGGEPTQIDEALNARRVEMLHLVLSERDSLTLASKLVGAML